MSKLPKSVTDLRALLESHRYAFIASGRKTEVIGGGHVDLPRLTTLPENTTFSNGGYVDLPSLTDEIQRYRGREIRLRHIDGFTMVIGRQKALGDVTISHARYFGGGDIDKLRKCFIATQGEYNAHGKTIDAAMRDLRFKIAAVDFDPADAIAEIVRTKTVGREQFRLMTGACDEGLRHGLEQVGLAGDADTLPLEVALKAAHGPYGERFKQMIGGAA